MYSPDKPYTVYCQTCWWSDNWNQHETARDYAFSQPFFEQFAELMKEAPIIGLLGSNNINSTYVNGETDDKNCYMNFGGHFNEDCYYNTYALKSKNCADNYWAFDNELVYESINPQHCYNSTFLQNCSNCSDCHFSFDLRGCKNCIGCIGLRQKEHHIFNQPYSEKEFNDLKNRLKSYKYREEFKQKTREFLKTQPHKATEIEMSENCNGDFIRNSKNCTDCFESEDNEDLKYVHISGYMKDSMDCNSVGWAELFYECMGGGSNGGNMTSSKFSTQFMNCPYIQYSWCVFNSQNLFGCVGLKKAEYCILNKQYSKEEFEQQVPQIIEHMKSTGEYGEFFPFSMSPFAYNESVAMEYHPIDQTRAGQMGSYWKTDIESQSTAQSTMDWNQVPDNIDQADDSITQQILSCQETGKAYKITPQEFEFYKIMGVPIPRLCPDERHKQRMKLRNPRYLWHRQCTKCQSSIQTSYSPERPEPIYCKPCYLSNIQ
jgi:hypothetical protein